MVIAGNYAPQFDAGIMTNGTLKIGTETTTLQVNKVWEDGAANHENDQTLVCLTQDGKIVDRDFRDDSFVILNKGSNWSYTWTNLGDQFHWGVAAASVDGYFSEVKVGKGTESSAIADKYYVAPSPTPPVRRVRNRSSARRPMVWTPTPAASSPWSWAMRAALWRALTPSSCRTAASLPVCGNVITFCLKHNQSAVVEGLPEGFTYELIEEAGSGCLTGIFDSVTEDVNGSITVVDVVNLSKVDITVEKQWNKDDDIAINRRPDSITINLMNGEDVVDTAVVKPGENGKWTHTFTDLPEYDAKGSKIACTVEKEPGKGYAGTAE